MLVVSLVNFTSADVPQPIVPIPQSAFRPVRVEAPVVSPPPPAVVLDSLGRLRPPESAAPRAQREERRSIAVPAGPPVLAFSATYYCRAGQSRCAAGYPDGPGLDLYAAISPDFERWRGRSLDVSYQNHHVTVKVIDCNCQAHRAIDLYADAFLQLAPLGAGRIDVRISEHQPLGTDGRTR